MVQYDGESARVLIARRRSLGLWLLRALWRSCSRSRFTPGIHRGTDELSAIVAMNPLR